MTENPASNPVREWSADKDAQIEAILLVKKLGDLPRRALRRLAETPDQIVRHDVIADDLGEPVEAISDAVARVNMFAEAFGFVPLISLGDAGYKVESGTATVVFEALAQTER